MKRVRKLVVALMLVLAMAAVPVVPFFQPVVVQAEAVLPTQEGREFIAVRELFEYHGGIVTWEGATRSIHIAIDGGTIVLFVGRTLATVNGVDVELQDTVFILNNTAFMYVGDVELIIEVFIETILEQGEFLQFFLTEEARDLVLYDFDFVVNAILENTPWDSVINRRLDIDFMELTTALRHHIYTMTPFTVPVYLDLFEEILGAPIYEVLFPIREGDDPRDIAANYLSYFLMYGFSMPIGHIGHLAPRDLMTYRMQYTILRRTYYSGTIDRDTNPFETMRFDTFTHPDAVRFYGEIEVDLYAPYFEGMEEIEGNIVTEIIVPGEIAYLGIRSFAACPDFDNLTTIPFFEEIIDFDHLIIDLRGNGGGWSMYFPTHIFSRLIDEPVEISDHQFFSGGDIALSVMNALMETLANWAEDWGDYFSVEIMPANDFVTQQGMTAFDANDLARLDYVIITSEYTFPADDGIIFNGRVWLLVDGGSASASAVATQMIMTSGRGTVVGTNTSGVMGPYHTYIVLPNTGMLFRMDIGYMTDMFGNSLEEHGIAPHVLNFEGMDALQTVLALIVAGDY